MDTRIRGRLSDWRRSGDPTDQAAAMREAIRYGALDPKMVQLAAFLGHPASRLIGDDVKSSGVVIKGHLVKNGEMSDLALGLSYFGRPAVLRINLALVRMAYAGREIRNSLRGKAYYYPEVLNPLNNLTWLNFTTYYLNGNGETERVGIPIYEWFGHMEKAAAGNKESLKRLKNYSAESSTLLRGYHGHNNKIANLVANLAHEAAVSERARPKVLKFCNGFFDDKLMLEYMRAEVFPWALGEFSEGYTTPEFIAHPPFVSRIPLIKS